MESSSSASFGTEKDDSSETAAMQNWHSLDPSLLLHKIHSKNQVQSERRRGLKLQKRGTGSSQIGNRARVVCGERSNRERRGFEANLSRHIFKCSREMRPLCYNYCYCCRGGEVVSEMKGKKTKMAAWSGKEKHVKEIIGR